MRQQNQNSSKPARFFPLTLSIVILTLLLGTWFGTTTSSFATPAMAPPAEGFTLTGFDSPQFKSKQYAYIGTNGVEELSIVIGGHWRAHNLSRLA